MKKDSTKSTALISVALLGCMISLAIGCNLLHCTEGSVCEVTKTTGPSAVPSVSPVGSPSPSPSPSPTPVSCTPTWLRIEGPTELEKNVPVRYWLTPMQTVEKDGVPVQVPVIDACNTPRAAEVHWSLNTDRAPATIEPDGFSVIVTRIVGSGLSTAAPVIPLQVQFAGLTATKYIY